VWSPCNAPVLFSIGFMPPRNIAVAHAALPNWVFNAKLVGPTQMMRSD
jgi:hypothetical protein